MMSTKEIIRLKEPGGLAEVAGALLAAYPESRIFAFFGPMGVGKTTFIKAICRELGAADNVSSPTFSIVNQYNTPSGENIFHFDFYRIKDVVEVYNLGYEEYFYSGAYCFIEWPEKMEHLLPEGSQKVIMEEQQGERLIRF